VRLFWIPSIFTCIYSFYIIYSTTTSEYANKVDVSFFNVLSIDYKTIYLFSTLNLVLIYGLYSDTLQFGALDLFYEQLLLGFVIYPCLVQCGLQFDERLTRNTNREQISKDEQAMIKGIGSSQTTKLRRLGLLAVLTLIIAGITALLSQGKMCFHDEDMLTNEQQMLCEKGAELMSSVDRHTKVLHGVLQGLVSSRGEPYPSGPRVEIPRRKENLKKKKLFWESFVSLHFHSTLENSLFIFFCLYNLRPSLHPLPPFKKGSYL
jgi:hypothetical protein